jgi:hypothetical protein
MEIEKTENIKNRGFKFKNRFFIIITIFCLLFIFLLSLIFIYHKNQDSNIQTSSVVLVKIYLEKLKNNEDCVDFLNLINVNPLIVLDKFEINFRDLCIVRAKKEILLKAKTLASNGNFLEASLIMDEFFRLTRREDKLLVDFKNMYLEFNKQLNSDLEEYKGPVSHIFFIA